MGNISTKKKEQNKEQNNYELTKESITNNSKILKTINKEHIQKHKGHKIYFLRENENLFTTIAIDDVKNKILYIYSFNNKNPDKDIIDLFEKKKLIDTNKNSITTNHSIILGYFDNLIAKIKYKKLFIPFGIVYSRLKFKEDNRWNGNNILLHYKNNIYIWIQGLDYRYSKTTKVSYNMFKVLAFEPTERVKYFNTPIEGGSASYPYIVTNKYMYVLWDKVYYRIEIKQYLKEVERLKLKSPTYKLKKIWNYYISGSDVYFDKIGSTYFESVKFPEIDFKDYNLKNKSKNKSKPLGS